MVAYGAMHADPEKHAAEPIRNHDAMVWERFRLYEQVVHLRILPEPVELVEERRRARVARVRRREDVVLVHCGVRGLAEQGLDDCTLLTADDFVRKLACLPVSSLAFPVRRALENCTEIK